MKVLSLILLIVSVSLAGNVKRTFQYTGQEVINVEIQSGGDIYLHAWDRDEIEIKVQYRGRQFRSNDNWLDIYNRDEEINVYVYEASKGVKVDIKAPRKIDLDLNTVGGAILVKGFDGDLEGHTMGGRIQLEALKGDIEFTTMGGDISLCDSHVDGKVSSMGGEIRIEDVTGDVDGSSLSGQVIYKNYNATSQNSQYGSELNISTMGGEINVDEALNGADLSTMGGQISVDRANKFVKASSMGGGIYINEIDGWVTASTLGGDIVVNMVGDPEKGQRNVELSSLGGDIILTLPEGISAEFDIRLTYTRNSNRRAKIKSDFELDIERSKEWDYDHGDPRKTTYGKGSVNGGKHLIKLSTTNGDIRIKKR